MAEAAHVKVVARSGLTPNPPDRDAKLWHAHQQLDNGRL